ncbi:hypothetical protein NDU88_007536, partial [Pleurodeles waltl]
FSTGREGLQVLFEDDRFYYIFSASPYRPQPLQCQILDPKIEGAGVLIVSPFYFPEFYSVVLSIVAHPFQNAPFNVLVCG